jgi:hypothetical protein
MLGIFNVVAAGLLKTLVRRSSVQCKYGYIRFLLLIPLYRSFQRDLWFHIQPATVEQRIFKSLRLPNIVDARCSYSSLHISSLRKTPQHSQLKPLAEY